MRIIPLTIWQPDYPATIGAQGFAPPDYSGFTFTPLETAGQPLKRKRSLTGFISGFVSLLKAYHKNINFQARKSPRLPACRQAGGDNFQGIFAAPLHR